MLGYAIFVTFALGVLLGCIVTVLTATYLDEKERRNRPIIDINRIREETASLVPQSHHDL